MRTIAIAQARMGSTRVPGKVMRHLGYTNRPVLQWTLDALNCAFGINEVVLATSTLPEDDPIADYAKSHNITYFRGNATDVLDRFYQCAKKFNADVVLRLTCDCPFLDPQIISEVVKLREVTGASFAANTDPPSYPDGLDVECFTFGALEAAWRESDRPSDRDCLTQYICRNRSRFPSVNLTCPIPDLHKERWVLDTEKDFAFCEVMAKRVGPAPSYLEVLRVLEENPKLREINNAELGAGRNERFYEQLYSEPVRQRRYDRSKAHFARAIKRIPFAAQTFSKSHLAFPRGDGPLFVSHADGARIFDLDGNDYVDLVGALCPIILGYRDPDVDRAVRHQLDSGVSFSLATELEYELAERLCRLIPCAEMVKFGKSGTDVTTAAVRVARAYTGRDVVIVGGYHGWADWSMCVSDRNLGIPRQVAYNSHKLSDGIHLPSTIAAIIVEPDAVTPDRLRGLRDYCDLHGIVLIFDEVITGFRYALGGMQEYVGIKPDLATFGKAMANGMPISAVVGRTDIMKRFEPPNNIFYSGTFFGETLSIAAAIATIDKLEREDVIPKLWERGAGLSREIDRLIVKYHLDNHLRPTAPIAINGPGCRTTLEFGSDNIKTYFIAEMIRNGVLILNANTISYAHRDAEMKRVISAYEATLSGIAEGRAAEVKEVIYAAPVRM